MNNKAYLILLSIESLLDIGWDLCGSFLEVCFEGLGGEGTGLNDWQLNEGPANQVKGSGRALPGGRRGCGYSE